MIHQYFIIFSKILIFSQFESVFRILATFDSVFWHYSIPYFGNVLFQAGLTQAKINLNLLLPAKSTPNPLEMVRKKVRLGAQLFHRSP